MTTPKKNQSTPEETNTNTQDNNKKTSHITYWIKQIVIGIVIFMLISSIADYVRMPSVSEEALQTTQYNINGEAVSLSDKEQLTVVYFWGSWCGICKRVSPTINDLQKDYKVVSVAMSSGDNQHVSDYLAKKNLTFSTINDPDGTIASTWQVQAVPLVLVIKNDKIAYSSTGYQNSFSLKARLFLLNTFYP